MKNFFSLLLLLSLVSCVGSRKAAIKRSFKNSEVFAKGHTGFVLYDPQTQKTVYSQHEDQYFIPASNTKLFTFYVAQKILGDSVRGLKYVEQGDSLIFWGTGDPSFLHPDLQNTIAYNFLRKHPKQLYFANNLHQVVPLGPGWAWDWYNYYFATERSSFPLYGNAIRLTKIASDTLFRIDPHYFSQYITEDTSLITTNYRFERQFQRNDYTYAIRDRSAKFELDRPFILSDSLVLKLLEDTLHRQVQLIPFNARQKKPHSALMTIGTDSLYKRMLQQSDNFIAEQLLVLSADMLFDSLNIAAVIDYAKKNFLADLPDEPQWVDGSGLSRNNLFTPRSIIALLQKIDQEYPDEKTLQYLPTGGKTGTLKNSYKADPPYVYAKTGSLNNVSCLSGYLITKSGKKLYFSFMHNNYVLPADVLRSEMEKILWQIHSTY